MTLPDPPVRPQTALYPLNRETAARKAQVPVAMSLLLPEGIPPAPARRLVVLVPDRDVDQAALARRIWNLAAPNKLSVLFLGLSTSSSEEPQARRQLATIAALTRDEWVKVSTALVVETDWLGALRPQVRGGDVIVCHTEQTLPGWRASQPLGHALCQLLQVPVYLLEGFYAGDPAQSAHPLAAVAFWAGAVAILVLAFWLQVQINALPKNWAESTLMAISVVAECGLIGLWSRVFNS
jgi:hypothetical protein